MDAYRRELRKLPLICGVAVGAGLLLGAVDLLAQRTLPYPWANLANSSAVWAVGAFAIGAWVRAGRWRPVLAGVLLLLVAVETYYLTAALVQGDSLANLWTRTTLVWLLFGVLAGAVFGTAGAWSRRPGGWLPALGVAAPGAVLFAEAAVLAYRARGAEAAYRTDRLWTALIELVLGLALILLVARNAGQRLAALAVAVPLALIGFAGFLLAGFGG